MYKAVQMDDGSIHLVHHGIKGQKWGERRFQYEDGSLTPAGKERYATKSDVRAAKQAVKAARKDRGYAAIGAKGLERYEKKDQALKKAETNLINTKASYIAGKKGAKAEERYYVKQFRRNGLPYSIGDQARGGKSARLKDSLIQQKGQEYTDRVIKKAQNQLVGGLVAGAAVAIGASLASSYLQNR